MNQQASFSFATNHGLLLVRFPVFNSPLLFAFPTHDVQILSGTLFYRIDGYESLYVVDSQNDPPYVQLELFKVREFQNWEDLIIEKSGFSPGGAQ